MLLILLSASDNLFSDKDIWCLFFRIAIKLDLTQLTNFVKHTLLAERRKVFLALDAGSSKPQPTGQPFEEIIVCQECRKADAEIFQDAGNFCSPCWMDLTHPEVGISGKAGKDEPDSPFLLKRQ